MEDVLLYSNLKLKLQVRKKKQQKPLQLKILSVEQCFMTLRRLKVLPQTIVKIYWRMRNLVVNTVMISNKRTTPWCNCGLWRTMKIRKQMKYSQHWWKSLKSIFCRLENQWKMHSSDCSEMYGNKKRDQSNGSQQP